MFPLINRVQYLPKRPFLPFHCLESLKSTPEAAQRVHSNIPLLHKLSKLWKKPSTGEVGHACK